MLNVFIFSGATTIKVITTQAGGSMAIIITKAGVATILAPTVPMDGVVTHINKPI